jgi:transcription-repair coupling factor (superfamily II helicase)
VNIENILQEYQSSHQLQKLVEQLESNGKVVAKGMIGSLKSMVIASLYKKRSGVYLVITEDKEKAAYLANDLEQLLGESDQEIQRKRVVLFPAGHKRTQQEVNADHDSILLRTEVLKRLSGNSKNLIIVSFPEAIAEKVATKATLSKNIIKLKTGEQGDPDFLIEMLLDYGFIQEDFVFEPGQFALRGGIVDVFSYSNDLPFRIEFFGNTIESIRTFEPGSQRSVKILQRAQIIPNVETRIQSEKKISFLQLLPPESTLWLDNTDVLAEKIDSIVRNMIEEKDENPEAHILSKPEEFLINKGEFLEGLKRHNYVVSSSLAYDSQAIFFDSSPQPVFQKNFDLLLQNLEDNLAAGIRNHILSESAKQLERIRSIFEDIADRKQEPVVHVDAINISLHEGWIDHQLNLALYTDHQIFERYHRFRIRERFGNKESLKLKELYDLQPGDFVTHVDHGIGRFGGLEKINNNGKEQEAIRLHYSNGDLLYVSIHSLHRISKYSSKDGVEPKLSTLGSKAWRNLKKKAKGKVKDIARELIALYAKRKASGGFAYSPDSYMQTELESSFIYEDTPDQLKTTELVKQDMESQMPMDRLVCGDVGFGKTEIAIRAAFKAAADNKQVAILVPTTILALQHYKTFSERLHDFPVEIEYLNRFKSTAQKNEVIRKLKQGRIDILIGTHRIISKDVVFKDLGLLIVDEEQKFGVSVKDRLKNLKVNVDTLTLTATPIPRTLQFSLMGARDLSIIATPPPNRFPVQTELHTINEETIKDAINYEISRRGQVYVINNRIDNIYRVGELISKLVPKAAIAVAHGQMKGNELEKIMLGFINGDYDVLISTTIIESGLDIPNANTMIIYDAQNFGLSDLHQLRGRVGRSNKKAFCYLLSPPLAAISRESRKRLEALVDHSNLGSGIDIAMRDLDIRGAGNLLGGEQSGFITDIGFEMYHQILDEAVQELKEDEFKELFASEQKENVFVKDTKIETDMELLIPEDYVEQTSERLSLYKQLDSVSSEEELDEFREMLVDRFGPFPSKIGELLLTLKLRWLASDWGFEKVILKQKKMVCWFVSDEQSGFFNSTKFQHILLYLQNNRQAGRMKEHKNKLSLVFDPVEDIKTALEKLEHIKEAS